MNTYFTSDYHLGHTNILKYDDRQWKDKPFKDISHHDEVIIANHNEIVKPQDHFYFLGDFGLTDSRYLKTIFPRLNGIKHFIKGNHDKSETVRLYEQNGKYLGEQKRIMVDNQDIILNHFALQVWDKCHKGAFHLYGHSHGALEKYNQQYRKMDVCIILNNYFPFEFSQIKTILDKREINPHH